MAALFVAAEINRNAIIIIRINAGVVMRFW